VKEPRASRDGGIAEEIGDGELRELHGEAAADLHDEERMAAEIEEAVLDTDRGDTEDLAPDGGDGLFGSGCAAPRRVRPALLALQVRRRPQPTPSTTL
jgi:hypothetical protein